MARVVVVDVPRSPLGRVVEEFRRLGVEATRYYQDLPTGEEISGDELLGVVIHGRRAEETIKLRSLPALAVAPIVLWYPSGTPEQEFSEFSRQGAHDFVIGPVTARELKVRLQVLSRSLQMRRPWLEEAVWGLMRVTRSLTSPEDDFSVLSTAAREMERLFPGVHCAIMMLNPQGGSAMVLTQGKIAKPLDITLDLSKYPEIRKVLATRRPVQIKNVQRHPLMREVRNLIRATELFSILAIPILYRDEVIGLIMLRSVGRPRSFGRTEISFCEMIAQSTAITLRNLQLSREMVLEVQQKKAAEKLAQQKMNDLARMEVFFDHAADGIIVADSRGKIRSVNVNFTRITGYTKSDVEGKNLEEILFPAPGESMSLVRILRDRKLAARRSSQILHCKDGGRKLVAMRMDSLPQRREWLISLHDLTEERELADALRRTKEFLENLIQSSIDAIIAVDRQGTIILFNRAAELISGYKAEDVIGKMNIVDFYAPGVARDIMRKLRSDEYGGRGRLEACYNTLISASGEEIPINLSASIIYEEGREVASVGIFQDLRERIRIEKELRAAQERLISSHQRETLSALSGAAAHELNQPLTSILGYSELLRRVERNLAEELPDHPAVTSIKNALDIIVQEAERMADVIRKLSEVTEYKTREYIGGTKILDLDQARGEPSDEKIALLPFLFQHMKESVIVLSEDTMIRLANPAAVTVLGENPPGNSFTRYLQGVEYKKGMEVLERVFQGGTQNLELELIRPDHEPRKIEGRAFLLTPGKDAVIIFQDVTEQQQEEQKLRDLCSFQDLFLKNTTLPLVAYNVDGKINFWNEAADRFFGYSSAEVRGRLPDFLFPEFNLNRYNEYLRDLRRKGDLSGEMIVRKRSGESARIFVVNSVMRDEKGQATGFLSMIFDLSVQKGLEAELQIKTDQLAVMNEIVETIRTGVGLEEVLGGALKKVAKVIPVDLCAVTIADSGSPEDLLVISYTPAEDKLRKVSLRLYEDEDYIRKLLLLDQPVVMDDISVLQKNFASGAIGREIERLLDRDLHSVATQPLLFRGEVLGTLHVVSRRPGFYGREQVERMAQLAGSLAMALANARLFNQIERQNLELAKRTAWMEDLIRAGQEITMEMRPEQALARLVRPYLAAHSWQHFTAWLEDAEEGELTLALAHNYPDLSPSHRLRLPENLQRRLRTQAQSVEVLFSGPEPEFPPLLSDARSALLVPLSALDRFLGLILLESHHSQPFREDEKVEVKVLATQAAAVLRNLAFYHELDVTLRFQRGLIENANALILILDREGKVVLINRAFEQLLGVPAASLLGTRFISFFEKFLLVETEEGERLSIQDRKFRKLVRQVEAGESMVNLRVTIRSVEGRESQAVFNTSTVLDREGRFQGFLAIGQNITLYRELEKHLLQAEKLASVGQMAAGIAHDLNNPVTGIINAATILHRRQDLSEKSLALVEQLTEEARRIENLAQNLMNYARPSRQEMFPLDLGQLIADSLSFSHYEITRGRVEVETRIPPALPPIRGIRDQLQQVFINLLINASHACAEKGGGKVVIDAVAKINGEMEITVSDTGIGIPPENLERLFDPFFTTKPEGKGTGLGLTIVRDIIKRHQGKIQVHSRPGEGTSFIITLPVYRKE